MALRAWTRLAGHSSAVGSTRVLVRGISQGSTRQPHTLPLFQPSLQRVTRNQSHAAIKSCYYSSQTVHPTVTQSEDGKPESNIFEPIVSAHDNPFIDESSSSASVSVTVDTQSPTHTHDHAPIVRDTHDNPPIDALQIPVDPIVATDADIRSWVESAPTNPSLYNNAIKALESQRKHSEALAVFDAMPKDAIQHLRSSIVSRLIGSCLATGDPQKGMSVYHRTEKGGAPLELWTYGMAAKAFGRAGRLDQAQDMLRAMGERGIAPNEVIYTTLLKGFVDRGEMDRAWEMFGQMRFFRVDPDDITYNTMVLGCARAKETEQALNLFSEMEEKGVRIDRETYKHLIHACAVRPDYHLKTFELVAQMRDIGFMPDERTFSLLLQSCSKVGNVRGAHLLWKQSTEGVFLDQPAVPNTIMYNHMMKVYSTALKALVPKVLSNHTQNHYLELSPRQMADLVLNSPVTTADAEGEPIEDELAPEFSQERYIENRQDTDSADSIDGEEEAEEKQKRTGGRRKTRRLTQPDLLGMTEKEEEGGSVVDVGEGLALTRDTKNDWTVRELLAMTEARVLELQSQGLVPNLYTANTLIEAYAWAHQTDTVVELLDTMEQRFGVKPNKVSYRLAISCCAAANRMTTAHDLWLDMRKSVADFHDQQTYLSLLHGCQRAKAHKSLLSLTSEMCRSIGAPHPNFMISLRRALVESDQQWLWDKVKKICLRHDPENHWLQRDTYAKEKMRLARPKKMSHRSRREWTK